MATATLEFEKPIVELEKQIDELKKLADERRLDVVEEIAPLEKKLVELREEPGQVGVVDPARHLENTPGNGAGDGSLQHGGGKRS